MKFSQLLLPAFAAMLIFLGCKKETASKTTCSATVYSVSTDSFPGSTNFGIVNPSTGTSATMSSVSATGYANQATFNTDENKYYIPIIFNSSYSTSIAAISTAGVVTNFYSATSGNHMTHALIFSPITHKTYALGDTTSAGTEILEYVFSGTSYSQSVVAHTSSKHLLSSGGTSSIDPATGIIYFATSNVQTGNCCVDKFDPATATTTPLYTGTGLLLGLCFNRNDNKLYAIHTTSTGTLFVSINSTTGVHTTLATVSMPSFNYEFYSAAFNSCTNQYMYSVRVNGYSYEYLFTQLNTSGSIVTQDSVTNIQQGLVTVY